MGRPQRYRGVRQRHWGSWVSEIRHPLLKTRVWLGTFETAEDAAHAYDEAARLMCGVKARTNFPYDPHAPKRASSQLLSATLTAKLHRWYLQSQQQEGQAAAAGKTSSAKGAAQSLTCLCLDTQQSHLGIYQKNPGKPEDQPSTSNWVRNVEFATSATPPPPDSQPASSSSSSDYSCLSDDDKFAAEMIEELLSWHSPGHVDFNSFSSPATSDSTCSSPFPATTAHSSAFVM